MNDPFVHKDSIVKTIWGKGDTILFIFAGASAEFALNKAVDWLYFTGKLPADPIGRLFSTVQYARMIVFSEKESAYAAIDKITSIHRVVEANRGSRIPDWAYRDVLFMLIHYSISAYELLEQPLTHEQKEDLYETFYQIGSRMEIGGLPASFDQWLLMREDHLNTNLSNSKFTKDLFLQYRKHLGKFRYLLLTESQKTVVPTQVKEHLGFGKFSIIWLILPFYKLARMLKFDWVLKSMILPANYKAQIRDLDVQP